MPTHWLSKLTVIFLALLATSWAQSNTPAAAVALEQKGDLPQAAQAWRSFIAAHPRDAGAYASLGVVLAKQQKYPEAAAAYKKALSLDPKLPGIEMNLGLAEFKQGHFHAAIEPLKAVASRDAGNFQAHTLLGLSYYGDKQYVKAIESLKVAVQVDPANVELQQIVAQSCLWAGQYQCALDGFRQILMTQPNSAAAHVLIGEALDGLGKTPEAIAEFRLAAQVSPREPNVHFGLGFLYWKSQDYEKAKAEFRAELANDGDSAQAWAYLGDTEMKLGNREAAASDLNKAIQLRSDIRLAYIDRGIMLSEENKYKDAIADFRKAIELDPGQPDAHYRLARAYQALGESTEAEKEFKRVQQLRQELDTRLTPKMSSAPPALQP
jgi:tetratricopeptide (TPR) repeat protein